MNRTTAMIIAVIVVAVAAGTGWYFTQKTDGYFGDIRTITFAIGNSPESALVHIASMEGYFLEQGLDVQLQHHSSGKAAANSLLEGGVDFAAVGDIPFMFSILKGAKIKLISTMTTTEDVLSIVVNTRKGIQRPQDLKGKKIGVTFGTGGHFFLSAFLTVHQIDIKDVEIVNLKPDDLVSAIGNGEIDGLSTWEPHGVRSQKRLGDSAVVFSSSGIHRETFNVATTEDFIQREPEIIGRALRALDKAQQLIADNPDQAITDIVKFMGASKEDVTKVLRKINFGLQLDQSLVLTLENESRWAISNKLVETDQVPNYVSFLYFDALERIRPEAITVIR